MRFLVKARPDHEHVNKSILEGSFDQRMQQLLSELKPEASYFFEEDGRRTAIFIVDVQNASDIVKVGEPLFHGMNSQVHFHPVMTPQDLRDSKVSEIAKKWGGA